MARKAGCLLGYSGPGTGPLNLLAQPCSNTPQHVAYKLRQAVQAISELNQVIIPASEVLIQSRQPRHTECKAASSLGLSTAKSGTCTQFSFNNLPMCGSTVQAYQVHILMQGRQACLHVPVLRMISQI